MPFVLIALGGLVLALTRKKTHGAAPPGVPANAAPPGTDTTPINPVTGTKLSLREWVKAHGFVGPLTPTNLSLGDFAVRAEAERARLGVEAAFFTMSGNPLLGVLVFSPAEGNVFAEFYGIGTR
jgi:hypothetical protein